MTGLRRQRLIVLCAAIACLVLAGCAARQPAKTPPVTPSRSEAYVSTPVPSGWLRTVGRANGLVLVFECEELAKPDKDLHYRFVVFNESSGIRSWDDALFVVNAKKADGYDDSDPNDEVVPTGFGAYPGDDPISYFGNIDFPGLTLRSGESTTHAGEWSGREDPNSLPYASLFTPSFKAGDRDSAKALVSAPHLTVSLE